MNTMNYTFNAMAKILKVSTVSIRRIGKLDQDFPQLDKIGKSNFVNSNDFYRWISGKAGEKVDQSDKLLLTKDIQEYYQKSHTWVWMHVKKGNIAKPFKINRTNYWLDRNIVSSAKNEL